MVIHVVKAGETIFSIAKSYDTSPERIIIDNDLHNPSSLAVGQTLVILYPKLTHTVKPGETLTSVAKLYGVTINQLMRNNPILAGRYDIYPGQTLVIEYVQLKQGTMSINGYAYPYIDKNTLIRTLPYLTYLSIFTYGFTPNGDLVTIDDQLLIDTAREYGVAPIMMISAMGEDGNFSNALASKLLNDRDMQARLVENILDNIEDKRYYGLDIDFEYILPTDARKFANFVGYVTYRLNSAGYEVITALAPKISSNQPGMLYEGHIYSDIGDASNAVLLMTYEWGYTYGPPMAIAPINKVREVLDYAITQIPPEKIFMGIPNYAYNWALPFVSGQSRAQSFGNTEAMALAASVGAVIRFDNVAKSPFYHYYEPTGIEHVVWFEDARSISAKLALIPEYGFHGGSYWNIMRYFAQNWAVLNSLYSVTRVLD